MRGWVVVVAMMAAGCGGGGFTEGTSVALQDASPNDSGAAAAMLAMVATAADANVSPTADVAVSVVATADAGPIEAADAAPDSLSSWDALAPACFQGMAVRANSLTFTQGCQPNGDLSHECAGCPGQYGYTCDDQFPPSPHCSQSTVNAKIFCCLENVCTPLHTSNDCNTSQLRGMVETVCNLDAQPSSRCTQAPTFGGGPNPSGTGPNDLTAYCCLP